MLIFGNLDVFDADFEQGVRPAFLPHGPQLLLVFVVRQRPPLAGLLDALPDVPFA